MKKYLTLNVVLKATAIVFGLVAFFLMFADQVFVELLGNRGYLEFKDALFDKNYGSAITFVGYLLVLLAALATVALLVLVIVLALMKVDPKVLKLICLGLAALFLLGAIFIFIEAAVINGRTDTSAYHLGAAPILAGIFAIISCVSVAGSALLADKSLVK